MSTISASTARISLRPAISLGDCPGVGEEAAAPLTRTRVCLTAWLATALAIVLAIFVSFSLPWYAGVDHWLMPGDVTWMTQSAQWAGSGALGTIYQATPWYLTLPGYLFLLTPLVELGRVLGLVNNYPVPIPHPSMWLLTGPFTAVACASVIPATDRLAATLAISPARRKTLALAIALLIAVPTAIFSGHGEDMLALAGVEIAAVAAIKGHWGQVGWIIGCAVLLQEWSILAIPVLVLASPRGERIRVGLRSLGPGAAIGSLLLALDWKHAYFDLVVQPAVFKGQQLIWWQWSKTVSIPGTTAAGVTGSTFRTAAVIVAVAAAIVLTRRYSPARIVAALAIAFFARGFFEVELWPYYLAPAAVMIGLLASRVPRKRLATAFAGALGMYAVSSFAYEGVSTNAALATAVIAVCGILSFAAVSPPSALRDFSHSVRSAIGHKSRQFLVDYGRVNPGRNFHAVGAVEDKR